MTATFTEESVAEGLSRLLQEKSAAIDSECERFLGSGDDEALHDLRVAMRRLHSLFTAFSHCFSERFTLPQRLHSLQRESNTARDLEVTLALLQGLQLELPRLQQQWQRQLDQEYRRLRKSVPPAWHALSREMARPQAILAEELPEKALAAYAAEQAQGGQERLVRKTEKLLRRWGKERAHKLRIRGKRVRYLLEPFAGESRAAASAVDELKRFQDLLGEYHDVVVLRRKLRKFQDDAQVDGDRLKHARRRLKKARRRLRKRFLHDYRGAQGERLREMLKQACEALLAPP